MLAVVSLLRAAFKTLVILVPLLGLTWILGYISIHSKSLVFQYLFAVINSMQVRRGNYEETVTSLDKINVRRVLDTSEILYDRIDDRIIFLASC